MYIHVHIGFTQVIFLFLVKGSKVTAKSCYCIQCICESDFPCYILYMLHVCTAQVNGPEQTAGSALTSHADKLKMKLLSQFSTFFSNFITSRICNAGNRGRRTSDHTHCSSTLTNDVHDATRPRVSGSVEKCFVSGCHLLCLLAQLYLSQASVGDYKGVNNVCVWHTNSRNEKEKQ